MHSSKCRRELAQTDATIAIPVIATTMLMIFLLVATPSAGYCESNGPNNLTPTSVSAQFQVAIDALAKRWGVAVVAESSPIDETPGADIAPGKAHEDAAQAVERVAAGSDYSVTRQEQVFVLKKRFTSKEDIPDVTVGEAYSALDNISHLLQSFEPHYPQSTGPWDARALAMLNVLSQEQIASLENGGVPIKSLSSDQRSQVWRFALSFYVDNALKETTAAADLLRVVVKQDSVFRWGKVPGANNDEFGSETRFGNPPHAVFLAISNPFSVFAHPDVSVTRTGPVTVNGVQLEQTDPTEISPAAAGLAAKQAAQNRTATIAEVAALLNSRPNEQVRCNVDNSLEKKGLTYAGLDYASSSRAALALAEAYGLEARHQHDGTITITQPASHAIDDIAAINAALMKAIPDSIRRCVAARMKSYRQAQPEPLRLHPLHDSMQYQFGVKDTYIESLREVRAEAQPAVLASKARNVPLSLGRSLRYGFRRFPVHQAVCSGAMDGRTPATALYRRF